MALLPLFTEGSQLASAHFENSDLEFGVRGKAEIARVCRNVNP